MFLVIFKIKGAQKGFADFDEFSAYCDQMGLIWFSDGRVYDLETRKLQGKYINHGLN